MLNVSNATKEAWRAGAVSAVRVLINNVEIDNGNIYGKSIKVNKSICDENALIFAGCIASSCEIQIRGIDEECAGQSIEIYDQAGDTDEILRFSGTIYTAEQDAGKLWTKITAYDALFAINNLNVAEWYAGLSFPLTLKQFRDSFFTFAGVAQKTQTLINDDIEIQETIGGEQINGSVIVSNICQLNAVFGVINGAGQFEYRNIEQTDEIVTTGQIKRLNYADYQTEYIQKVVIREDPDDIGAIVGTGENAYIIEGNFICYGKSANELETIANRIYNAIYNLSYTPFDAEIMGLPFLEVGDVIILNKPDGGTISSVILSRKTTGDACLWDNLKANGARVYAEAVKNNNNELIQLRGQTNRLTRTVEGMTVEVETIREDYASKSMLQQTSDALTAQIEYLQSEIDGEVQIYNTTETPTLLNYPAWDFTYNIPVNNTIKTTNDLHFNYTDEYYQRNLRSVAYDEENNIAYRFQKVGDTFGWVEIADTEFAVIMQRLSRLEITAEQIEAEVEEITQDYATKTELQSEITQSAEAITQTVSATYTTKQTTQTMQTQINQQAQSISAKVSQTGGQASTFGWELTSSAFSLKSQNDEVFRASANGLTVKGNFEMTGGKVNILTNTQTDNSLISLKRVYNNVTRWTTISEGRVSVIGANGAVTIDDGKLTATASDITAIETHDITIKNGALQTRILPANYVDGYVIPRTTQFNYGSFISATSYNLRYSAEAGGYVFASLPTFVTGYALSSAPSNGQKFVYSL